MYKNLYIKHKKWIELGGGESIDRKVIKQGIGLAQKNEVYLFFELSHKPNVPKERGKHSQICVPCHL